MEIALDHLSVEMRRIDQERADLPSDQAIDPALVYFEAARALFNSGVGKVLALEYRALANKSVAQTGHRPMRASVLNEGTYQMLDDKTLAELASHAGYLEKVRDHRNAAIEAAGRGDYSRAASQMHEAINVQHRGQVLLGRQKALKTLFEDIQVLEKAGVDFGDIGALTFSDAKALVRQAQARAEQQRR